MKHCLVTVVALLAAASSFAQGTVTWNNSAGPVTLKADGSLVTGAQGWVTILVGGAPGALAPTAIVGGGAVAAPAVAFRDDVAGKIRTQSREVPGLAAGTAIAGADFQMVAWNKNLYGDAGPAQASWSDSLAGFGWSPVGKADGPLGGGINLPSTFSAAAFSVNAVPEPSIMALGLLGAGLLLIRRKK